MRSTCTLLFTALLLAAAAARPCCAQNVIEQTIDFAPAGTTWDFVNRSDSTTVPIYRFTSLNDTLVARTRAMVIACVGIDIDNQPLDWGREVLYGDSNRIYCLSNGNFVCVFNFKDPPGTVHTVSTGSFNGFFQFAMLPKFNKFSYVVLRTGSTTINGRTLRTMELGPDPTADWTFGINSSGYDQVTEGLACTTSWTLIGGPRYIKSLNRVPILCFKGNIFSLRTGGGAYSDCDSITGLFNRIRNTVPVKASPNPFREETKLMLAEMQTASLQLFDSQGRKQFCPVPDASGRLNLAHLSAGVYFLQAVLPGNRLAAVKLVKE